MAAAEDEAEFKYVLVPAAIDTPLIERASEAGWAGDQIPDLVKAAFASGSVSEAAVREHAHRAFGERASGLDMAAFQRAVAEGTVETVPLVRPCASNGCSGVYAYIDEAGLLKGLPKNERACSLASACGLDGAAFHGDAFIGRVVTKPEPPRNKSFTLADMASDAAWLRRAPADNAEYQLEMQRLSAALDENARRRAAAAGNQGADEDEVATVDGSTCVDERERVFGWSQANGDVEVHVPIEPGTRARDVRVALGPRSVRVERKAASASSDSGVSAPPPYLRVDELYAPIRSEESTWEVGIGEGGATTLTLTMNKVDGAVHWPRLTAKQPRTAGNGGATPTIDE